MTLDRMLQLTCVSRHGAVARIVHCEFIISCLGIAALGISTDSPTVTAIRVRVKAAAIFSKAAQTKI